MRLLLVSIFLAGLVLPAAARAEWRELPYADLAKMPLLLKRVDPDGVYRARYLVKPGKGRSGLPDDLKIEVVTGGSTVPVALQPDRSLTLPIRADWVRDGAKLRINQPKGVVTISLQMDTRTPPGTRMRYAQLTESAPIMERGIKEMAGVMRFMAPKLKVMRLKFEPATAQTLTLHLPDTAPKTFRSDAKGQLDLPWNPAWIAAEVTLSAPLKSVTPVLK